MVNALLTSVHPCSAVGSGSARMPDIVRNSGPSRRQPVCRPRWVATTRVTPMAVRNCQVLALGIDAADIYKDVDGLHDVPNTGDCPCSDR